MTSPPRLVDQRGPEHPGEQPRVDRVADEPVGAGGDELRLGLLGHRHPPVAAEMHASPDRQSEPGREGHRPDRSEGGVLDGQAPAAEDTKQEDHGERAEAVQRDPAPGGPALLHAERGREPVDPEDDPGDADRGLEGVHVLRRGGWVRAQLSGEMLTARAAGRSAPGGLTGAGFVWA